jgi:arsenate reductase
MQMVHVVRLRRKKCSSSAGNQSNLPVRHESKSLSEQAMNILFLCTGNSCRSILAEATFNALAPQGMRAMSAGSKPTGEVHPRSLALLKREGISTEGYYSKSWDQLPVTPDLVITVCGNAAGETCPAYLGNVMRAHWGVEDPAKAIGTDEQIDAAFEKAYAILRRRIEAFLSLNLTDFGDRANVQQQLDAIGTIA